MVNISIDDARMMYKNSLVLRHGRPTTILNILYQDEDALLVEAWDLGSQSLVQFLFDQEELKAPDLRLGFLNLGTNCVYLARNPSRVYKIGFNAQNLSAVPIPFRLSEVETKILQRTIQDLDSTNLYSTLTGNYPAFEKALEEVEGNAKAVAFDRQFCVDRDKKVYFKDILVGEVEGTTIKFIPKFKYLRTVLPKGIKTC